MLVMSFFDFNFQWLFQRFVHRVEAEGTYYERRPDGVLPAHGRIAQIRIRQVCPPVWGQLSSPVLAHLRAVPGLGLCPIDLPREPSGYRNLSARFGLQTLSCRHWPTYG